MIILQSCNLKKHYQMGAVTVQALCGVDLAFQQGEFAAIMGPSGSGKSTLLHLLGGLDVPTSGEVVLAGQPLSKLKDDELTLLRRHKIGFVFQFFNLIPTLTTVENIALPLLIDGKSLSHHRPWVNTLLDLMGLVDRQDHRPDQLSGGEQQRVAIARAFINRPEIVLADEPTGNLDSHSGTTILELLTRACRELNATIVMVTHDPRAASYSERVIFMKDGQVVSSLGEGEQLSIQQIMAEGARLEP